MALSEANDPNRRLEIAKKRTAELKEQMQLRNQMLGIIDRQRAGQKQQLDTARQQLKTSKDLLAAEKNRVQSVEATR